jgi:hypothetical protein
MNYWFGYRVIELDGSNPGGKCLLGPFSSYEDAKEEKQNNRAKDIEQTAIFTAKSNSEAEVQLGKEPFLRF